MRFYTNPGSRYAPVREPYITSNGGLALRETGVRDVQAYIESYRPQTDMAAIIARFNLGDISALHHRDVEPMMSDFVGMPHTIVDFLNLQHDLKRQFDGLPVDVRGRFDHSFDKFFASFGTEDFFSAFTPAEAPTTGGETD